MFYWEKKFNNKLYNEKQMGVNSILFLFNFVYNILMALNLHRIVETVNWKIILSNLFFIDEDIKAKRS